MHWPILHAAFPTSLCAACIVVPCVPLPRQIMWSAFGVIWDLRMFGLVGLEAEEVVNLCCDFAAKV